MAHRFDRVMSPSSLANTISYMSTTFSKSSTFDQHAFFGFLPVEGQYTWGVGIDGVDHVAVHVFGTPEGFCWGDDPKDTEEESRRRPWVLMFLGADNSSCFMRFKERETAVRHLSSMSTVHWKAPGMLRYNS